MPAAWDPHFWSPGDWARIERIARAERSERAVLRAGAASPERLRVARAVADGAAVELRQWADVAAWLAPARQPTTPLPLRLLEDAGL